MIQLSNSYYLHIPKTAGTFIRRVLKEASLFESEIGHSHDKAFDYRPNTFTFVRLPDSWIQSLWSDWNRNHTARNSNKIGIRKGIWSYKTFSPVMLDIVKPKLNDTVECLINKYPGFISQMYKEYTANCNMVGKQENLRNDLITILTTYDDISDDTINTIKRYPKQNVNGTKEKIDSTLLKELLNSESYIMDKWYG